MRYSMRLCGLVVLALLLLSCFPPKNGRGDNITGSGNGAASGGGSAGGEVLVTADNDGVFAGKLAVVMRNAELPGSLVQSLQTVYATNPAFIINVYTCLAGDRRLRELVDKHNALDSGYVPPDLVLLDNGQYLVNRAGMTLRYAAAVSLDEMAAAARADGVTLLVSSAYRSYQYQEEVYNRIVRQMGREAADRESARPGHSQHQTGLVIDFGSIDDSFALTAAGRWMTANASRFGWSLSYPDGYEEVTGYRWESWHYRYVGGELAAFIDNYFGGIQQYALRFLHEWSRDIPHE